MRILPVLLFTCFFFSCMDGDELLTENLEQQVANGAALILNANEGVVYLGDQPFTGLAVYYYSSGQIAAQVDYLNGKKHGTYVKYFESGLKSYEVQYLNGKRNGESKSWWVNGNLRTLGQFKEGVAQGEQWQYYSSGAKFKKMNLVDGREEGMQQSWRENGKIYNNYEARNGRIFGLKRAKLCYQLNDEEIQF